MIKDKERQGEGDKGKDMSLEKKAHKAGLTFLIFSLCMAVGTLCPTLSMHDLELRFARIGFLHSCLLRCASREIGRANNKRTKSSKSPIQAAFEAYKKALATVKTSLDRVSKDLQEVSLIEARLKTKAYSTKPLLAYLEEENRKVTAQKDRYVDTTLWNICLGGQCIVISHVRQNYTRSSRAFHYFLNFPECCEGHILKQRKTKNIPIKSPVPL